MIIPNAGFAEVDVRKLSDYCLNFRHPRGRHKAQVFVSALGLTSSDAEKLRQALLDAVCLNPAVAGFQDEFGRRYVVDFWMVGPTGQARIRSSWIVRTGESFPRLTSCCVI